MCQETFLRAFRALPGFRGQAKFSSWLYRIALTCAATGSGASAGRRSCSRPKTST